MKPDGTALKVVGRKVFAHSVSVRVARGGWQLVVRYRERSDDGSPEGPSKAITKMSGLSEGEPKSLALDAAWAWRDELLCEQAVTLAREQWDRELGDNEIVGRLESQLGIDRNALSMPFRSYAKDYVATSSLASGRAKAKQGCGNNPDILRLWILPFMPDADIAVRDLKPRDVSALLNNLEVKGYAPATIKKAWTLFRSIIRYAINVHGLKPDPTYGIHPKKVRAVRVNYLEVGKADALASELSRLSQTPAVCAARLALAAGICAEESAALTLDECDPSKCESIHITSVISKRDGVWGIRPPKVDPRDRIIPMNDELRAIITDRIAELSRSAKRAGVKIGAKSYLLDNPGRTKRGWITPDRLRAGWRPIAEAKGLRGVRGDLLTIHDLRHTFATSFLAKGGSVADLKAIMGHSTPFMTLTVYAASDPTIRAKAMELTGREIPSLY